MQDEVFGFDPSKQSLPVDTVNILLCGGVGAGKSSVASTVDSICQGSISRRAPHGQGTGSLTRKLRKYSFTNPHSKGQVKWQLWDSMGWGVSDYKGGELGFILDGNLPDKCKLDACVSMKTNGFQTSPSLQDIVHCMCLVVPCESATDESYMSRLQEMPQFARDRGEDYLDLCSVCTESNAQQEPSKQLCVDACGCPERTLQSAGFSTSTMTHMGGHHVYQKPSDNAFTQSLP